MPTFIGHAAAGAAISVLVPSGRQWVRVVLLCLLCAIAPDLDGIGFKLGIPYGHWLGHRGFSHSICFAVMMALTASMLIAGLILTVRQRLYCCLLFFVCTISHAVLDAMTNGGLGVAFFSPFNETRYFLPWRPIQVSPMSLKRFLSSNGMNVIKSELVWVILPSLSFLVAGMLYRLMWCRNRSR